MTSQQIENLFACRVLTSLLNAATSVVQMYKGIHPNIHHPWYQKGCIFLEKTLSNACCVASTRNLYVQIVWEFECGKIWMLSSFLCENAPRIMAFWTEYGPLL